MTHLLHGVDWAAVQRAIEDDTPPDKRKFPPIEPGLAPGGIVFQTWAALEEQTPDHYEELIAESRVRSTAGITERAEADADRAIAALRAGRPVQLRIYDGDSGAWLYNRTMVALRR